MAAAYVAGVAAVIRGRDPVCDVAVIKDKLLNQSYNGILSNVLANTVNLLVGVATTEQEPSCNAPKPLVASCRHIIENGDSVGDGLYLVDPDGDNSGVEPFEVYCDMTTQGGGWTLIANHKDGLEMVKESPVVTPDDYAVMNKNGWNEIKKTVRFGALFIDENQKVSVLTKHGFIHHSCQYFAAHNDLSRMTKYGHWVGNSIVYPVGGTSFFYNDNHPSGYGPKRCVSIDEHTTAALFMTKDSEEPGNTSYKTKGASLISGFINGQSNFAVWPYRGIYSQNEQNELLYFVK